MLSVHWITDVDYYLDQAKADYYFRPGEPQGRWWGAGARKLGLIGTVTAQELKSLCKGYAPDGKPLIQNAGDSKHQQAWDLTFSAPKSVSVLWSQAPRAARLKIRKLHHKAIKVALQYLTEVALLTRRGKGGFIREHALPLVAIFEHGSNRELEPQLHSHCVLVNVAARLDGTFGTILSKPIYNHKLTAGAIYQIQLARLLRNELGLQIVKQETAFDVVGVPQKLLEHYSTRSKQIRERLGPKGSHTAKAAAEAALDTRRSKKSPPPRAKLLKRWQAINREFHFTEKEVERLLGKLRPLTNTRDLSREITLAIQDLLASESYFSEQRVIRNVAIRVMGEGLPATHVIENVRAYIATNSDIVPMGDFHDELQFTTREILELEKELFRQITAARNESSHLVERTAVERLLDERLPLSANLTEDELRRNTEQRAAVLKLATDPGSVAVLEGMAGTGKTYTLSVARQAWEKAGFEVTGMALSAVAARNLQDGSGIPSDTIAMRLLQLDGRRNFFRHHKSQLKRLLKRKQTYLYSGRQFKFHRKSIVIVDEAGMVGTRQMVALMKHARSAGAKIIFIGDRRQIQPVDAGGPFRFVADGSTKAELNHVVRQKVEPDDPNPNWHREAGKLISAGQAADAIKLFAERGRFHRCKNIDEAMLSMVRNWSVEGISNPGDHILLAGTNAAVNQLNAKCQAARLGAGVLRTESIEVGSIRVHVNDIVLFTKNSRICGVSNGDRGTVLGFNRLRKLMAVQLEANAKTVFIPYRSYTDFQLGYAMTTHKAQGATVPSVHVLLGGPMQDIHLSYVQSTRAQDSTRLYVDRQNAGPKLRAIISQMQQARPKRLATELMNINESGTNGTTFNSTSSAKQSQAKKTAQKRRRRRRSKRPETTEQRPAAHDAAAYQELVAKLRQAAGREPVVNATISEQVPPPKPETLPGIEESKPAIPLVADPLPVIADSESASKPVAAEIRPTPSPTKKAPSQKASTQPTDIRKEAAQRKSEPPPKRKTSKRIPHTTSTPTTLAAPPLSHLNVMATTDLPHLNRAVDLYGKLPGGIVVEGIASCDFPIQSLAIDHTDHTRLIINGTLRFDTKLTPEELALLWEAVLVTGDARRVFGVVSQQEAIGVASDSLPGVTMMTADNYFGAVIYGHDAQLSIYKTPISGYTNPFEKAALAAITDDDDVTRQCFNYLYEIQPRVFLTVASTHFSIGPTNVVVPSVTQVTLAIGVVDSSGNVIERVPLRFGKGSLVVNHFPNEYAAFVTLQKSFVEFAQAAPSFVRTIAYAETVLLLRRAKADNAAISTQRQTLELAGSRERIPLPRFNYTLRSVELVGIARETADKLLRNVRPSCWLNLPAWIVAFKFATLAGDLRLYGKCKEMVASAIVHAQNRLPLSYNADKALIELARLFPVITKRLENSCHDDLVETCVAAALRPTRNAQEKNAYLLLALERCGTASSLAGHTFSKCRRLEIVCLLDPKYDPLPELVQIRQDDPSNVQAFDSLDTIRRRRLATTKRIRWPIDDDLAVGALGRQRASKLIVASGSNDDARPIRQLDQVRTVVKECLSERETNLLIEELRRFGIPDDEFLSSLSKQSPGLARQVLAEIIAKRLRSRPANEFNTRYLHSRNPFVYSHDLLDYENIFQLKRLYFDRSESVEQCVWAGASFQGSTRRFLSKVVPSLVPQHPGTWWSDLLRQYAVSPDTLVSKTALLLMHDLRVRGLSVVDLFEATKQFHTANPQAAMFFCDCVAEERLTGNTTQG